MSQLLDGDGPWMVNAARLATIFGVSRPRIHQLVATEGMPRGTGGRYDLAACVQWWGGWWRAKSPARNQDDSDQRQRLIRAQADKVELETAILRGTVIRASDVEHVMARAAALIAGRLDGVGPRLAGELAAMDDPAQIQEAILREHRAIRSTLADAFRLEASLATSDDDGVDDGSGDTEPAADTDSRPVGGRAPRAAARKPRAGTVEKR